MTSALGSGASAASASGTAFRHHTGAALFLAAILAVCALAWWTDRVRPLPNPYESVEGLRWWITPVERNGFMRLPAVQGDIADVRALPDSETVWAVGEGGLIIGTNDGGRSWQRGRIVASSATTDEAVEPDPVDQSEPPPERPRERLPAAAQNRAPSWSFFPSAYAADLPPASGSKGPPDEKAPPPQYQQSVPPVQQAPDLSNQSAQQTKGGGAADRKEPAPPARLETSGGKTSEAGAARTTEAGAAGTTEAGTPLTTQAGVDAPQPSSLADPNLRSVAFVDSSVGVAVGEGATLLRTQDGGVTWARIEVDTEDDLSAVAASPKGRIVAVGGQTILYSEDGGLNWKSGEHPVGSPVSFITANPEAVQFTHVVLVDEMRAVAVTDEKENNPAQILLSVDGGATWASVHRIDDSLNDLAFASPSEGIAVGDSGTVLRTADGGRTWRQVDVPAPLDEQDLVAVAFLDEERGMVLTREGAVLVTGNAGRSWVRGKDRHGSLNIALAAAGNRIYSAGFDGAISVTNDLGETWLPLTAMSGSFSRLDFTDSRRGIAVGDAGVVMTTNDGGSTWTPRRSGLDSNLNDVEFTAASNAVTVGDDGAILFTRDAGYSWTSHSQDSSLNFQDIAQGAPETLLAVASNGAILRSSDAGQTWSRVQPGAEGSYKGPACVAFVDERHATAVWPDESLLTDDAGLTWSPPERGPSSLWERCFVHESHMGSSLVVVRGSAVEGSDNAGENWIPADGEKEPWMLINASSAWEDQLGVAVGRNGTVLRTYNGGEEWSVVQGNGAGLHLQDVRFLDEKRVVTVGSGRVFLSTDSGRSWAPVSYRRYPSPWIWVAGIGMLIGAAAFTRTRLRSSESGEVRASVTDAAVSDEPLSWKDPDALGLREIALAISRFLRNRRTVPPLTIAVEGEWGTGKSSLMNLLRQDLSSYGFRPVWFNAWHHQSGENLLGSLLANIHAQAVPPWHTLAGIDFRLSLLSVRARRFWLRLALSLFLLVFVIFCYRTLGVGIVSLWEALAKESTTPLQDLGAATGLLGLLAALLTPLIGAVRALSAFGLQPGKLIAAVATTKQDESARQQAGARYRFAREFADFSNALNPRTLVIFIDDLDRCRPKNVIDVLEAVNFLVTSGRCVVVLGMARRWVEACVEEAFKELAPSRASFQRVSGGDGERSSKEAKGEAEGDDPENRRFARDYLEKLINIEIRIPRLSEQASRVILDSSSKTFQPPSWRNRLGGGLLRAAPVLGVVLVAAGIVGSARLAARWLENAAADQSLIASLQSSARPASATAADAATDSGDESSAGRRDREPAVRASEDNEAKLADTVVFEPTRAQASDALYIGTALPLLLSASTVLVLLMLARRDVRTDDSADFRDALHIMQPWIVLGGHSPRSLKRFVNHLRYVAMRFREEQETPSSWERLKRTFAVWFDRAPPEEARVARTRHTLDEHLLVALASIYRCNERWPELFVAPTSLPATIQACMDRDFASQFPDAEDRRRLAARLHGTIRDLNARFPNAPLFTNPIADRRHVIAFLEVMAVGAGAQQDDPGAGDAPPPTHLRPAPRSA